MTTACSSPSLQPVSAVHVEPSISADQILTDDAYTLPLNKYTPKDAQPSALVIALHGFNDYSRAFDGMCRYLAQRNIACVAYDQRGFGRTRYTGIWPEPGRLQADLRLSVKLLRQEFPDIPLYVAGESMGGAVLLTTFSNIPARNDMNVSGAILLAPAVWARHTQPWYQRWALWMAVHTFPGWQPTGESLGVQATDNIEALRQMARDDNVIKATRIDTIYGLNNLMDKALNRAGTFSLPALVLYGNKDEVIPKKPTCEMLKKMEEGRVDFDFVAYPEGYHMLTRDLQADKVFADIVDWISHSKGQALSSKNSVVEYCHSLFD